MHFPKFRLNDFFSSLCIRFQRLDVRVPMYRKDNVFHFLHIGRTGGSELRNRFKYINMHTNVRILHRKHYITLRDIPASSEYLLTTRDPVQRFISAFESLRLKPIMTKSRIEKELHDYFSSANDLAESLFDDSIIGYQASRFMNGVWHLAQKQSQFVCIEDIYRRKPFFHFHTENLDIDFQNFCNKLGINTPPLSKSNSGGYSSYDLSPKALNNLKIWYSDDYSLISSLDYFTSAD